MPRASDCQGMYGRWDCFGHAARTFLVNMLVDVGRPRPTSGDNLARVGRTRPVSAQVWPMSAPSRPHLRDVDICRPESGNIVLGYTWEGQLDRKASWGAGGGPEIRPGGGGRSKSVHQTGCPELARIWAKLGPAVHAGPKRLSQDWRTNHDL